MKTYRRFLAALAVLVVAIIAVSVAIAAESQYAAHATSSVIRFGPAPAGFRVMHVYAKSDKATSVLEAQTAAAKRFPTAIATNAATVISLSNVGNSFGDSTNNRVLYVHADGKIHDTTISASTASNITLTAGLTQAGAAGDAVYRMGTAAKWPVGSSAALTLSGGYIWAVPGDSPLRMVLDSSTNGYLTVTTDR